MKKISILLAILGLCTSTSAFAKDDTIRFGMNPEYPPFEYKTEKNEIVGFDVDVANALCETLKKKCEFVEQQFNALIPNLRLKRFDAIISSMDITEERKKQVAFTDSYYLNPSVFVAIKGTYKNLDELKGKTVGVLNGSTHQLYIENEFKQASSKNYPQYPNAINDLFGKRVDAVFGDEAVVVEFIKKDGNLEVIGEPVNDPKYFGSGLAIAVLPKNTALVDSLNGALKTIKEDGRYQAIYDKWFKQ